MPPTPTLSPKPLAPGPEKGGGATRCIPGTERQRPPSEPAGWPAREVGGGNPTMPTDSAEECKSPLPGEDNHPLSKTRGSHLRRTQATRQTGTAAGKTEATCKTEKKTGPMGHPITLEETRGTPAKSENAGPTGLICNTGERRTHPHNRREHYTRSTSAPPEKAVGWRPLQDIRTHLQPRRKRRSPAALEKSSHLQHRRRQDIRHTGENENEK